MSFKKILIAIDSSMDADFILEKSDQFMPKEGAQISLMSVVEPLPSFYAEIYFSVETYEVEKNLVNEGIERAKEKLMDLGRLYGIQTNDCHVIQGDVVTEIHALAEKLNIDLLVMGSHCRKGFQRFRMGSTATAVIHGAKYDIHIVRLKED
jgi:universal stress protein A|tara:strand:+ start:53 stop:505 length:453 start_codon:yes stop_codon:yes gene_type:complete